LLDFVVSCFHLDGNLILYFCEVEFGLGEQGSGILDLGDTLASIEKIVGERNAKGAEVMNQEGNAALVTVSREAGDIRDVSILCRG
jgi:hypothetical protein